MIWKKKVSTLALCFPAPSSCVVRKHRKHSTCCLWVDVEDDGHAHIFKYITQSWVWVLKTGSQSSRWEILVAFTEEEPGAPA